MATESDAGCSVAARFRRPAQSSFAEPKKQILVARVHIQRQLDLLVAGLCRCIRLGFGFTGNGRSASLSDGFFLLLFHDAFGLTDPRFACPPALMPSISNYELEHLH